MKIEIDLNDILGDEYGAETLNESIKRQVIDNLTKSVSKGIKDKIDSEVSKAIQDNLVIALADSMPGLIDDLMEAEYQPINQWGDKQGTKTTFRSELIKSILAQMTYKKETYSDRENFFTQAVNQVISEEMKIIQSNYKKQVDEAIGKEAFSLAIKTLKDKLGLS